MAEVDKKIETANTAHAALQQPPDLKAAYDQAFDRLVTGPGTLMQKMLALTPSSLDAMLALADYAADNAQMIRVVGMDGTSVDPVVDRHLHELIDGTHKNDDALADLKRQLTALASGT